MNNEENEYLNNLFAGSSVETGGTDTDIPLLQVPESLTARLFAISARTQSSEQKTAQPGPSRVLKMPWRSKSLSKVTGIAASLLMATVVTLLYQQQQTLRQLEQAQRDLATALHYLGEANEITRAQMINSLNTNLRQAAVAPVIEIGRDALLQPTKPINPESEPPPGHAL